ncbi:unnamed protein product [Adineta steineri]|uniref:Uncharacterized protein n=1 Tax=Adineta steineri TaxID=433720 RepID=A0A814QUF1_9BILA|nr:unnamed protein product [Adineta steineri]CAF4063064.1 unnamed protein product [Adineta steineri]
MLLFNAEICDQSDDFVTLDDDYIKQYNPFSTKNADINTAQPTSSSDRIVKLRITLLNHIHCVSSSVQSKEIPNENPRAVANRNEQQQTIDHEEPIQKPPEHSTLRLSKHPKMRFIKDRNVREKQRDQYVSDQTSVRTGEKTGLLSMIQTPKKPEDKQKSILPRFIIKLNDIKNRMDHNWTLLVFIVLDVYQEGIRSLLKHSKRIFVDKNNVTQQCNPYEIPITINSWTQDEGVELKLIVVAIEGAKTHPNAEINIICYLEDTDKNELSNASPDSSKSRLALVLRKDDDILWETLVLSDAMHFERKNNRSNAKISSNILTNTATALKRKRPTKIRMQSFSLAFYREKRIFILDNTSTKQVTWPKTNEEKNNSPIKLTQNENDLEDLLGATDNIRNDHNLNMPPDSIDELFNDSFDITAFVHDILPNS